MINKKSIKIGNFRIGNNKPFFLMAGPCAMQSLDHCLMIAEKVKKITKKLGINYIFKSSYDKANRTSVTSYRGLPIDKGLRCFEEVKKQLDLPVVSDFHTAEQAKMVAEVVDIIQVPAFLSRQTDVLEAAAKTKLPINVKKMQQLAPSVMKGVVKKLEAFGNNKVMLCERGSMFGYGTLVNDIRSIPVMAQWAPVVIDCTHSCQFPGSSVTGGNSDMAQVIAGACVANGVAGVFAEVHEDPKKAPCDAANMIKLDKLEKFLKRLVELDKVAKKYPVDLKNDKIWG